MRGAGGGVDEREGIRPARGLAGHSVRPSACRGCLRVAQSEAAPGLSFAGRLEARWARPVWSRSGAAGRTRQRRRSNASRKADLVSIPPALALMLANPTLRSFAQYGTRPHRSTSRLRSPALASNRTTGSGSVGATFQLGGKFGIGRSGGIEKTSLISLTSEERRTRPHIADTRRRANGGPLLCRWGRKSTTVEDLESGLLAGRMS